MSLTPQKAPHMHRPKPIDRRETLRAIFDLPAVRIIHQALAQMLESKFLQFRVLNRVPPDRLDGIGSDGRNVLFYMGPRGLEEVF